MPSKSLLNLTNSRLTVIVALAFAGFLHAEEREEKIPYEDMVKIRLWNMTPPPSSPLRITVEAGKEEPPLVVQARWQEFTSYGAIRPKKKYNLSVVNADDGKEVGKIEIAGEKGKYYTILAKSANKGVNLSAIDDTYAYSSTLPGRVAIYLFAPGYKITASVPDAPAKTIATGEGAVFENLANNASVAVNLTRLSDGKSGERILPFNFQVGKRVSCLFLLDRNQRMAVRTMNDGFIPVVEQTDILPPEPEATATPAATAQPQIPVSP